MRDTPLFYYADDFEMFIRPICIFNFKDLKEYRFEIGQNTVVLLNYLEEQIQEQHAYHRI